MNHIEILNLSKAFKVNKGATVKALKNLSLTIERGEVFGFLGPNGAGKSTTIKILMGLIHPSSGSAHILGHDVGSHLSRKGVGYLPENPAFYDYLSAEEYLTFIGNMFRMDQTSLVRQAEHFLKLLELWDARKRPIRSYSKGMVQRLGLAQVLIHDPDIYILDEPMSGLDPIGRALVKDIILQLKQQGKSVFFSTHITADVESVCDRVGILLDGSLRRVERVASIMMEGIVGYTLHVKIRQKADAQEVYVPKEELTGFMQRAQTTGHEVTMIEPKRKNLEEFFLDIVKEGKC